ncbi:hypothetical protein BGW38_001156 [Lunasporangiospora selenospora]|uniref:DASH complex subunit SPC19 n=1 Tax=Lunasporangiospora selenospora TaxID=979761 RepID=A0A9P6KEG1_9FUNG|nr:hypothetical protein BGW38_001156 [Lunasporangiospora selenospora]
MDQQGIGHGGYGFSHAGHGLGSSVGSRYSQSNNPRRTLAPSTQGSGLSYLPSLQRCVATLEESTQRLKSTVAILDEATAGYPRLKAITSHKKQYELVSEQDVTNAQSEVAKDVEPQLIMVTEKATQIVLQLEQKEYQLMDSIQLAKTMAEQRTQRQKAARSGLSSIKKLQSLTKRKEELSRTVTELDTVIEQKRYEFHELVRKEEARGSSNPAKRLKLTAERESRDLDKKEEEKRKEINRRQLELESIRKKIDEKRRSLINLRRVADTQTNNPPAHKNFDPSGPWKMYSSHYNFLGGAIQTELRVDTRDKNTYEETFERIFKLYEAELDPKQSKTDKEMDELTKDKSRKMAQLRNLCRQLFPDECIGQTMVRLLELLIENPHHEVYHRDLVQSEFPPEEERRHNLGRVMTILKQFGVIEPMLETVVDPEGEEGQEPKEQLVLRIKFEDNTLEDQGVEESADDLGSDLQ